MSQTAESKRVVTEFYDLALIERKYREAAAKYIGDTYIQHNPNVPDGREAFLSMMDGLLEKVPTMQWERKKVIAEGAIVVVHAHVKAGPDDRGRANADFFRVESGKIVEHWDVSQPIPETAVNQNGMV